MKVQFIGVLAGLIGLVSLTAAAADSHTENRQVEFRGSIYTVPVEVGDLDRWDKAQTWEPFINEGIAEGNLCMGWIQRAWGRNYRGVSCYANQSAD